MGVIISGIQQVGVGIPNVQEAFAWYRKAFGMDIPIFDEAAEANRMLPYTDGRPQSRHAILAISIQGGGGLEIWQYVSRTPQPATFEVSIGDLGIYSAKIKSMDVPRTHRELQSKGLTPGMLQHDPLGNPHFFIQDPYGNLFQIVKEDDWFSKDPRSTGGISGAMVGVSDIDASRKLYSDILGYDQVIYDKEGKFDDIHHLPGGTDKFRRVLLTHSEARKGAFSKMFGPTSIELIQAKERAPKKIFENRLWGDLGFIHLCFDINGMSELEERCKEAGFPFTVDSRGDTGESFDMGEAAGHFSYIEDPDGTLIEFVETHKIPIIKKIGWYLNLRKRDPEQALPNWMLKTLALGRVRE
ncbi:MAG: VOC family protein [Bacteroidota bacterium]